MAEQFGSGANAAITAWAIGTVLRRSGYADELPTEDVTPIGQSDGVRVMAVGKVKTVDPITMTVLLDNTDAQLPTNTTGAGNVRGLPAVDGTERELTLQIGAATTGATVVGQGWITRLQELEPDHESTLKAELTWTWKGAPSVDDDLIWTIGT